MDIIAIVGGLYLFGSYAKRKRADAAASNVNSSSAGSLNSPLYGENMYDTMAQRKAGLLTQAAADQQIRRITRTAAHNDNSESKVLKLHGDVFGLAPLYRNDSSRFSKSDYDIQINDRNADANVGSVSWGKGLGGIVPDVNVSSVRPTVAGAAPVVQSANREAFSSVSSFKAFPFVTDDPRTVRQGKGYNLDRRTEKFDPNTTAGGRRREVDAMFAPQPNQNLKDPTTMVNDNKQRFADMLSGTLNGTGQSSTTRDLPLDDLGMPRILPKDSADLFVSAKVNSYANTRDPVPYAPVYEAPALLPQNFMVRAPKLDGDYDLLRYSQPGNAEMGSRAQMLPLNEVSYRMPEKKAVRPQDASFYGAWPTSHPGNASSGEASSVGTMLASMVNAGSTMRATRENVSFDTNAYGRVAPTSYTGPEQVPEIELPPPKRTMMDNTGKYQYINAAQQHAGELRVDSINGYQGLPKVTARQTVLYDGLEKFAHQDFREGQDNRERDAPKTTLNEALLYDGVGGRFERQDFPAGPARSGQELTPLKITVKETALYDSSIYATGNMREGPQDVRSVGGLQEPKVSMKQTVLFDAERYEQRNMLEGPLDRTRQAPRITGKETLLIGKNDAGWVSGTAASNGDTRRAETDTRDSRGAQGTVFLNRNPNEELGNHSAHQVAILGETTRSPQQLENTGAGHFVASDKTFNTADVNADEFVREVGNYAGSKDDKGLSSKFQLF